MPDTPNRQMYRTPRAALYLGLSDSTLEKMRVYGRGPKYCKLGRSVVYDPADLDEWLNANRRASTSEAA